MSYKIKVQNLNLEIPIISPTRSFRETLKNRYVGGKINTDRSRMSVTALKNISFTLNTGDRLALIGHNGAGKTTLLRALAGIYKPVQGSIVCNGHVTPLFNTAPGLDYDSTGIENIKTMALYFGMTEAELNRKMDDIISFTELDNYIDLPVRTYSNGMVTRLCYSVATAIEPDILLLDEGISVGDQRFADKAKARLDQFYKSINVLVCASHSNELLKQLCNKAMLLDHGEVVAYGEINEVIEIYSSSKVLA